MPEPRHIKSKERVRDLGEVYTQPREVNAMLDLIPDAFASIDTRFFEPAAGDGNFLVAILDWAHGGIGANALARRWRSVDLYNLNGVTMDRLLQDTDLIAELEQIEDFRTIREEAAKIVTASNKLSGVKRAGGGAREQRGPKKEIAEKWKNIREKLKKVSAKVLIFMYLTDFREERLAHIFESLDTELFLRSTGLSLGSYAKLTRIGVIVSGL